MTGAAASKSLIFGPIAFMAGEVRCASSAALSAQISNVKKCPGLAGFFQQRVMLAAVLLAGARDEIQQHLAKLVRRLRLGHKICDDVDFVFRRRRCTRNGHGA